MGVIMKFFATNTSRFLSISVFILLFFLGGCGRRTIRSEKLLCIEVGMDKQQVIKNLGKPTAFRGCLPDKSGNLCEVFEYSVDRPGTWDKHDTYVVGFYEGKLKLCIKSEDLGCLANNSTRPPNVAVYNTTQPASTTKYVNGVPVTGYGEISKVTGRPRTKIVSGHWRHTSKGLTWINPYARS